MTRSTTYVALDVHKEATAATVRNARGKVIARSVFATEEGVFLEFFRGMRGSIHDRSRMTGKAPLLHAESASSSARSSRS
jgi:hypothetical protein